jgi:hypothetical protein
VNQGVMIVIGRESIKENNLVTKLPRFFFDSEDIKDSLKCRPCTYEHFVTTPCAFQQRLQP